MSKTKKISITLVVIVLIVGILSLVLYMKNNSVGTMFVYSIDKERGVVIIEKYINDELESEKTKSEYKEVVEIPKMIRGYPVTVINEEAFIWAKVKTVIIPETVTEIGSRAFFGCKNLESIEGIESVEIIKSQAFYMCSSLEDMHISKLKYLEDHAFFECTGITFLNIPNDITEIPYALCNKMESLNKVKMGENTTVINELAFANCTSLKEIEIPESVIQIADNAFKNIESQLTIYGVKGSYAEKYADDKGIVFIEKNNYIY